MTRFRAKDGAGEVDAVRNTGKWGPIIEFLGSVGSDRVPFGSRPPITRNEDGTLHVCAPGACVQADVGDWVTGARGVFDVVKPDAFDATYEEI